MLANVFEYKRKGDGVQRIDVVVSDIDLHLLAYAAMRLGGWLRVARALRTKRFKTCGYFIPCLNNIVVIH